MLFALCWFGRLVAYGLGQGRVSAWFAVAPLAGLLVAGALGSNLPMEARWSLAQDDFDRAVRGLTDGGPEPEVPGRIGGYRVVDTERVGEGVRFVTGEDFWGRDGFAWFPDGAPPGATYEHLRGGWDVWNGGGVD